MSVHLLLSSDASEQPITIAEMCQYFHAAAKPTSQWRIGAEFEKIAVERTTGRQISYHEVGGIRDILHQLADRFAWQPFAEDGQLTTLFRDGATISLEPGAQLELSTRATPTLAPIAQQLQRHLQELAQVSDRERIAWLAIGVSPFTPAEQVTQTPRRRHRVMAEYLPQRSATALQMMRSTASTQVTFDYADEYDAIHKFRTVIGLGPIVNALWANSPLYHGTHQGLISHRGRIWSGMDPNRSGLLTHLLQDDFSFARWVDYLLDVPMMFVYLDDQYHPAEGRTFRDFLQHGIAGYFPTLSDWELLLTTVFPEVRLKRFLEVRGADANAFPLAMAVPAFWTGLLYDAQSLDQAYRLAESIPVHELPWLFTQAARQGLKTVYQGRTLLEWNRELVQLAYDGLTRRSQLLHDGDERSYLEPLLALLERGCSPAEAFLQHLGERPATPSEVIAWFEHVPNFSVEA